MTKPWLKCTALGLTNRSLPALDFEGTALKAWSVVDVKRYLDRLNATTEEYPCYNPSQAVFDSEDWSFVENTGYKLWLAQYANREATGFQSNPWNSTSSRTVSFTLIEQYSSAGQLAGYGGRLDLELFKGSREDWLSLAGIELSVSSPNTQTKTTPSELEDDELMRFTYEIIDAKTGKTQGTVYYYDGSKDIALTDNDQLKIERQIYKDVTGRDLKHYQWSQKAPWYIRHLQAINQRAPQVAWK